MTRLIFVDEELVMVLEADLPAAELVNAVQNQHWQPPPALAAVFGAAQPPPLRAVRLGRLVIVSPCEPYAPAAAAREVRPAAGGQPQRELSARQLQVLQALADGLTDKEIAAQLGLHARTVQWHIVAIKGRFGTSSRMQSVLRGVALGLCKVRPQSK